MEDGQREGKFNLGTQVSVQMYEYLARMKQFKMRARKQLD